MKKKTLPRRSFLKASAATAVGVGGKGRVNLRAMDSENIVALCDVDWADYEPRLLTRLAGEYRVATQMGNQGNSAPEARTVEEWIHACKESPENRRDPACLNRTQTEKLISYETIQCMYADHPGGRHGHAGLLRAAGEAAIR